MDILPLLDELQIIARNGLHYAQNPYDRERYERLMELTTRYYGEALDLPPANEPQTRKADHLPVHSADKGRQHVLAGQHARGDLLRCSAHVVEQIQQTRQFGRVIRRRLVYC